MQASYADCFVREMGCTEAELLGWLPAALGDPAAQLDTGAANLRLGSGALRLTWQVAAPRVIGLIRIPVLRVSFRFDAVDDLQRDAFMKRFVLYMQRGGG